MADRSPFARVYDTHDPAAFEDVYDDWADSYDADLDAAGYATPDRLAAALADHAPDRAAPILDFACGSGLSGLALRRAGFTTVDGTDISQRMLDRAAATGAYRSLAKVAHDAPLPTGYAIIAATGAISRGAAPPETLDAVAAALPPGGLLALSYNDHTLEDPAYTDRLAALVSDGTFETLLEAHGPHLPDLGLNATVYILRRGAGRP